MAQLREPRAVAVEDLWVCWQDLFSGQHRIELCGDSKVVVNWHEAFWPVLGDNDV